MGAAVRSGAWRQCEELLQNFLAHPEEAPVQVCRMDSPPVLRHSSQEKGLRQSMAWHLWDGGWGLWGFLTGLSLLTQPHPCTSSDSCSPGCRGTWLQVVLRPKPIPQRVRPSLAAQSLTCPQLFLLSAVSPELPRRSCHWSSAPERGLRGSRSPTHNQALKSLWKPIDKIVCFLR